MPFPSVLNTFNRPTTTDRLNSPSHSALHNVVSSALGQVEAVIGVDGANSVVGTMVYNIRSPASDGGGHVQTASKGGTGQTTYAKGDILIASSSSVLTKLAVGGAGQVFIVNDTTATGVGWGSVTGVPASVKTVIPKGFLDTNFITYRLANPSLATVGQVVVPAPITASVITMRVGPEVTVSGTADITLYQEDGIASMFTVTTLVDTANSNSSVFLAKTVNIPAGNYYVMMNTNTTTNFNTVIWGATDTGSVLSLGNTSNKPMMGGQYIIPAGAPPTSISTTGITSILSSSANDSPRGAIVFRIDG